MCSCMHANIVLLMHHEYMQGDKLADNMLMIGIALTIFPIIIVLSVWSAIGVEFYAYPIQNNVSP